MIRTSDLKWVVVTILLFVILPSCQKDQSNFTENKNDAIVIEKEAPGECDVITDLLAGQFTDVGDVHVTHTDEILYITYYVNEPGWCLMETHLHVAGNASLIPQTKRGNPKVGRFDYQGQHDCITEYTYEVPIQWPANVSVTIAAHAVVAYDHSGNAATKGGNFSTETAWAEGEPFPGNSWAMHFDYFLCFDYGGGIGPESEIAYAYGPDGSGIASLCFYDAGINALSGWGWQLGPIYESCTLELRALPGLQQNCELVPGFHVGMVEIDMKGKRMDITITTFPGYSFNESHLWVSDSPWNIANLVDPEEFPYHAWDLSGSMVYTYTNIPREDQNYMILYALVYGVIHEDDPGS
jgi:hypothetical protein